MKTLEISVWATLKSLGFLTASLTLTLASIPHTSKFRVSSVIGIDTLVWEKSVVPDIGVEITSAL